MMIFLVSNMSVKHLGSPLILSSFDRCNINHEGPLLPREVYILVVPALTFRSDAQVKAPEQAGKDSTHLGIGEAVHVSANTFMKGNKDIRAEGNHGLHVLLSNAIPWSCRERIQDVSSVIGVLRVNA